MTGAERDRLRTAGDDKPSLVPVPRLTAEGTGPPLPGPEPFPEPSAAPPSLVLAHPVLKSLLGAWAL
ncbi:MAG: MDMPI N domain containing protein, partial [Streptomyces sp.]|nr:MDMPI N domain containing protein [Streptomyces sp.]